MQDTIYMDLQDADLLEASASLDSTPADGCFPQGSSVQKTVKSEARGTESPVSQIQLNLGLLSLGDGHLSASARSSTSQEHKADPAKLSKRAPLDERALMPLVRPRTTNTANILHARTGAGAQNVPPCER